MEVLLGDTTGLSDSSIVSIRFGGARRQARVDKVKLEPLKFPATSKTCWEPMKIEVMDMVAGARLVLRPNETRYNVNLYDAKDLERNCACIGINLTSLPESEEVAKHEKIEADADGKPDDAREYLETHGLLRYMQGLLHAVLRTRPQDPYRFIMEQLSSAMPRANVDEKPCPPPLHAPPKPEIDATSHQVEASVVKASPPSDQVPSQDFQEEAAEVKEEPSTPPELLKEVASKKEVHQTGQKQFCESESVTQEVTEGKLREGVVTGERIEEVAEIRKPKNDDAPVKEILAPSREHAQEEEVPKAVCVCDGVASGGLQAGTHMQEDKALSTKLASCGDEIAALNVPQVPEQRIPEADGESVKAVAPLLETAASDFAAAFQFNAAPTSDTAPTASELAQDTTAALEPLAPAPEEVGPAPDDVGLTPEQVLTTLKEATPAVEEVPLPEDVIALETAVAESAKALQSPEVAQAEAALVELVPTVNQVGPEPALTVKQSAAPAPTVGEIAEEHVPEQVAPAAAEQVAPAAAEQVAPAAAEQIAPAAAEQVAPAAVEQVAPAAAEQVAPAAAQQVMRAEAEQVVLAVGAQVELAAAERVASAEAEQVAPPAVEPVALTAAEPVACVAEELVVPAAAERIAPAATEPVAPAAAEPVAPVAVEQVAPAGAELDKPVAVESLAAVTIEFVPAAAEVVAPPVEKVAPAVLPPAEKVAPSSAPPEAVAPSVAPLVETVASPVAPSVETVAPPIAPPLETVEDVALAPLDAAAPASVAVPLEQATSASADIAPAPPKTLPAPPENPSHPEVPSAPVEVEKAVVASPHEEDADKSVKPPPCNEVPEQPTPVVSPEATQQVGDAKKSGEGSEIQLTPSMEDERKMQVSEKPSEAELHRGDDETSQKVDAPIHPPLSAPFVDMQGRAPTIEQVTQADKEEESCDPIMQQPAEEVEQQKSLPNSGKLTSEKSEEGVK